MDFNQTTSLPLLARGSNNTHFEDAPSPQEEDLNYLGDYGSSGSASQSNENASTCISPPSSAVIEKTSNQKQKLERKGHTKSRRGCYNCKRRRIKCQENRPSCEHCIKQGLKCEYPVAPQLVHQPQNQTPLFSMQDMRFFQHFLLSCSPHQPMGNDSIWLHEVPCLSQKYEYLMHAILGLAASDLMRNDPNLLTFAMAHRLKAIKAVKKTLTNVPKSDTFEEGNALLATCYALTFQSVMLDDGMAEFMTFCRGIVIVITQMYYKGAKFLFSNFLEDDVMTCLKPLLEDMALIRQEWTDMAVTSIAALAPLCKQQVELDYHQLITTVADSLRISSFLAYKMLSKHYGWWMQMPHKDFQNLIDGENQVHLLLATHWISLKVIMAPIFIVEHKQRQKMPGRKDGDPDIGMIRWLKHINRHVDTHHQQYNQWPLWVEAQLARELRFFGKEV